MLIRRLSKYFLLTLLLTTFSLPSALAVPNGPVIGKVTLVLGQVTGQDQDGDTFEVVRGADLYAGYTLETARRSFVRAELNDGTRMTVSQNGSATLDGFSFNESSGRGQFNATVAKGGFRYVSGRLGSFGRTRVHSRISTPSGVIGVRGTTIEAEHSSTGLVINITSGSVDITYQTPSGGSQTTVVGADGNTKIASISIDGVATPLTQVPPQLQAAISTLIQMVEDVGGDVSGGDTGGDDGGDDAGGDDGGEDGGDDGGETGGDTGGDDGGETGGDTGGDDGGDTGGDTGGTTGGDTGGTTGGDTGGTTGGSGGGGGGGGGYIDPQNSGRGSDSGSN